MEKDALQRAREEVYYWQKGQAGGFTSALFDLIGRADHVNQSRLANAFPFETRAYFDWYHSEDPEEFFDKVMGRVEIKVEDKRHLKLVGSE